MNVDWVLWEASDKLKVKGWVKRVRMVVLL